MSGLGCGGRMLIGLLLLAMSLSLALARGEEEKTGASARRVVHTVEGEAAP